jgi:hypothetical protein
MKHIIPLAALLAAGALPLVAQARPFPPGRCAILDDGVATRPDAEAPPPLQALSMPLPALPPTGASPPDHSFVADVSLSIEPDGSTARPYVMCATAPDPSITEALLQIIPEWRFQRTPDQPQGELRAAYRIVASGTPPHQRVILLGWSKMPPPPAGFEAYGAGANGRVSLKMWQDHDWKTALAQYDADHDGRISQAEFVAFMCSDVSVRRCASDVSHQFIALDRNHDGFLDRTEFDSESANFFRQNDRNHDGYVTREEMESVAAGR